MRTRWRLDGLRLNALVVARKVHPSVTLCYCARSLVHLLAPRMCAHRLPLFIVAWNAFPRVTVPPSLSLRQALRIGQELLQARQLLAANGIDMRLSAEYIELYQVSE